MILSCNSCEKKFVVPDDAISASGRLVQCSSCGNKWKQFPIKEQNKSIDIDKVVDPNIQKKITKITAIKKPKKTQKRKRPDLYSPEYLSKKHGIKIKSTPEIKEKIVQEKSSIYFGFYNYFIVLIIVSISFLKILSFIQGFIISVIPGAEIYIDHLFETLNNIYELLSNFFSNY
jgi:predicted Zn finger-like uncharacterized protein